MAYSTQVWQQLKNITRDRFITALEKDGWKRDVKSGAVLVYYLPEGKKRITIHYHSKKTYSPDLLKGLLAITGWDEEDFKRLKLIKKH